jgi:hypothetical protein
MRSPIALHLLTLPTPPPAPGHGPEPDAEPELAPMDPAAWRAWAAAAAPEADPTPAPVGTTSVRRLPATAEAGS